MPNPLPQSSLCNENLIELSNPGASGSLFYVTADDEFIIKTVQHKEAEFLQKLLPGYYMNLNQNPRTLLPKFFGLYCYQSGGKNIRLVVMNNLLPSTVRMHLKYDLKGSTFKRRASPKELSKPSPTRKDLDFQEDLPEGFLLEQDTYQYLMKTVTRDCIVLESFKIMDFSLLIGVHNLDIAAKERERTKQESLTALADYKAQFHKDKSERPPLLRSKSYKNRLTHTAMESIQHPEPPSAQTVEEEEAVGGIPARNHKGDRLMLYIGVIDILQRYKFKKKLEHTWKSMLYDGDTVSVHRPNFYSSRFREFLVKSVFKKSTPMKHSPTKKRSIYRKQHSLSQGEVDTLDLKKLALVDNGAQSTSSTSMDAGVTRDRSTSEPNNREKKTVSIMTKGPQGQAVNTRLETGSVKSALKRHNDGIQGVSFVTDLDEETSHLLLGV